MVNSSQTFEQEKMLGDKFGSTVPEIPAGTEEAQKKLDAFSKDFMELAKKHEIKAAFLAMHPLVENGQAVTNKFQVAVLGDQDAANYLVGLMQDNQRLSMQVAQLIQQIQANPLKMPPANFPKLPPKH